MNFRPIVWSACLGAAFLAAGCADRADITTYTVENVSQERPRAAATMAPGQAWFFKLMGKEADVQAQADAFARLMASVRFADGGTPAWDPPAGWTERKENGMRFATLVLDGSDPPLELAVSALPSDDPGSDAYLKSNIDRWRGQLGLPPYAGDDWKQRATDAGEVREANAAGGRFVLVQLSGQDPAGERLAMLAAIVPRPSAAGFVSSRPPQPTASSSEAEPSGAPTFTAPAEWASSPPRQFQTALWTVGADEQKLEISLSQSGGSMEANLQRWRTQLGDDPNGAADPATESISVGGASATRVELKGAEKSILGVIVPRGGTSWFFKMMGPAALVDQERERFHAFIDSVQFP